MKICAIIAEFNPFHLGHEYLLKKAKEVTSSDYIICIMSGNFVERGDAAMLDKWERTKMALSSYCDLVIELPTLYSVASAEYFAQGSINILNALNCVDYLCFGAESDNINMLKEIAKILADEPDAFKNELKESLSDGVSYPKARCESIVKLLKNKYPKNEIEQILEMPNNILAIEYLKSLIKTNSSISPVAIKRIGDSYHSLDINSEYPSASAIRNTLLNEELSKVKSALPESSFKILSESYNMGTYPISIDNFEKEIFYKIATMTNKEISNILDVEEGLENVISNSIRGTYTLEELINKIKSKRYTQSRIQRILIHILLNIRKDLMTEYKEKAMYARVLGIGSKGKKLLSYISSTSSIPVITSLSTFMKNATEEQKRLAELDVLATNIYNLEKTNPKYRTINEDYLKPFLKM